MYIKNWTITYKFARRVTVTGHIRQRYEDLSYECVCKTSSAHVWKWNRIKLAMSQLNLRNGLSVNRENFDATDWQSHQRQENSEEDVTPLRTFMKLLAILNHPRSLHGFLSDQQTKYNCILIFIPIFPGDISDLLFSRSLFGFPHLPGFQMWRSKGVMEKSSYHYNLHVKYNYISQL